TDFESAAIDHSATSPVEPAIIAALFPSPEHRRRKMPTRCRAGFGQTSAPCPGDIVCAALEPEPEKMSLHESHQKSELKLRALGWQGQLDQADRPDAVLAVARDYLAQVSPEEVALLPEECRPMRLVDADDVANYAFELARNQVSVDAPEVLHK